MDEAALKQRPINKKALRQLNDLRKWLAIDDPIAVFEYCVDIVWEGMKEYKAQFDSQKQ